MSRSRLFFTRKWCATCNCATTSADAKQPTAGLKLLESRLLQLVQIPGVAAPALPARPRISGAYQIYKSTVKHRRFNGLPEGIKQIWKIFEAYLFYLIQVGRIKPDEPETIISRIRIMRFLNDVPIFSKDRRGMNIPILNLPHPVPDPHQGTRRGHRPHEAIQKYASRYLKKDDNYRSNCFIKMLLEIPDAGFHRMQL
jgi:hypothetical protein